VSSTPGFNKLKNLDLRSLVQSFTMQMRKHRPRLAGWLKYNSYASPKLWNISAVAKNRKIPPRHPFPHNEHIHIHNAHADTHLSAAYVTHRCVRVCACVFVRKYYDRPCLPACDINLGQINKIQKNKNPERNER